MARDGSFHESGFTEIDWFELFAGNASGGKVRKDFGRRGKVACRREELRCFGADDVFSSRNIVGSNDAERFYFENASRFDLITRGVQFLTLGIDHNGDEAIKIKSARLFREDGNAADANEFHVPSKLPALSDRNGGANAGVGTWA